METLQKSFNITDMNTETELLTLNKNNRDGKKPRLVSLELRLNLNV